MDHDEASGTQGTIDDLWAMISEATRRMTPEEKAAMRREFRVRNGMPAKPESLLEK